MSAQRGGHAKFDGEVYTCVDCNAGMVHIEPGGIVITGFSNHVHRRHKWAPPPESRVEDVIAARRLLGTPEQTWQIVGPEAPGMVHIEPGGIVITPGSVFGMSYDEWAKYGSQTCDDCGRSDGTHNMAVEH